MKIGVFDSGIGGKSVASAIEKGMPEHQVVFRDDSKNLPYGNKSIEAIYEGCLPVLQSLETDGCEVIVVACNTVSTNLIDRLRQEISVPLVAVEPMVKPASEQTKSKVIAVCATPRTLSSKRYESLKQQYAIGIKVIEPDCSDWTSMIENDEVDKVKLAKIIDDVCDQGADVIVLGCTHYHWIEDLINDMANNRAVVLQPEQAVIKQLNTVIKS